MPRVLDSERNVLEMEDNISGCVLTVFYGMPSNSQRVRYSNALTKRQGGKVKVVKNVFSVQASFGLELLLGIKKGDFVAGGRAFASEQSDPDYDPKWRDHMVSGAPDVLAHLARTAFGSVEKPALGVEFEDLENPDEGFTFADPDPDDASATTPAAGEAVAAGDPLS